MGITAEDKTTLRELAQRLRDMAAEPVMEERRRRWYAHNALERGDPLVLAYPEGSWRELVPDAELACEGEPARSWERSLRRRIFQHDFIDDDSVVEPDFICMPRFTMDVYGVEVIYERHGELGAYTWKAPISDLSDGIGMLRQRAVHIDEEGTRGDLALAGDYFGDILEIRPGGISTYWTFGLTQEAIKLIGLEQLMLAPYDSPEQLHALMSFLRDEHLAKLERFEREGLLRDNNLNGYTGSGGVAYTRELPAPGRSPGAQVRAVDLWGFAESQETIGWSPAMFHEFVFPYQLPLLGRFGLNCYGCCEPVDTRLDDILSIPRLRRVSVSPWAKQEPCAEAFGRSIIFSRKPNPALVCAGFDEESVRADLAATVRIARDCNLEIIMKDTHTFEGDRSRPGRWVRLAREAVASA